MAMETRYGETRKGYVLNGEKAWITNATQADVFVIFATKDVRLHSRGISAFLVERGTPGVTQHRRRKACRDRPPGNASLGTVTLRDVHIGREALIGRVNAGAQVFRHAIVQERILLSAFLVGSIRRALRRSIGACADPPAIRRADRHHQYVSGRIVDISPALRHDAWLLLSIRDRCRLALGSATEADASPGEAPVLREARSRGNLDAFRIHGAKGLDGDGGQGEGLLDALSSITYSGTSDLQRVIIAASLGLQP